MQDLQDLSMRTMLPTAAVLAFAALLFCRVALTAPQAEHRYAGELTLTVDLTDPAQKIFRVRERIPVQAGAVTLYYPKWIPGEHSPSGPVDNVTGLIITADHGGQRVEWRR